MFVCGLLKHIAQHRHAKGSSSTHEVLGEWLITVAPHASLAAASELCAYAVAQSDITCTVASRVLAVRCLGAYARCEGVSAALFEEKVRLCVCVCVCVCMYCIVL